MALYTQAQCIRKSTCELCDKDAEVEFKCIDCDQFLCMDCKGVHSRSKASMDHEVQSAGKHPDEKTKNKDRNGVVKIQRRSSFKTDGGIVNMCHLHPKRRAQQYCKDCDEIICKRCIITLHSEHNFCSLYDVTDEKMSELRDRLVEIQNVKVPALEDKENILNTCHARLDGSEKSVVRDIKQASKKLQAKVMEWEKNLLKLVAERSSQEKKKMWENKEIICDELSNLDELQTEYLLTLASKNIYDIIKVLKRADDTDSDSNIPEIEDSDAFAFKFFEGTGLKGDDRICFGDVTFPGEKVHTRHYREVVPQTSPAVMTHPLTIASTYEQGKTAF